MEGRDKPQIQDWGTNYDWLKEVVTKFKELPMNFICTCLENPNKDETTGRILHGPELPGKMAAKLPQYFDIVGRLSRKVTKDGESMRLLSVQPTANFHAKDRTNKLGIAVENPTFKKIYQVSIGGYK